MYGFSQVLKFKSGNQFWSTLSAGNTFDQGLKNDLSKLITVAIFV